MRLKTGSWFSIVFVLAAFLVLFSLLGLIGSIPTNLENTTLEVLLIIGVLLMLLRVLESRRRIR
jgi:hypothetical protein